MFGLHIRDLRRKGFDVIGCDRNPYKADFEGDIKLNDSPVNKLIHWSVDMKKINCTISLGVGEHMGIRRQPM